MRLAELSYEQLSPEQKAVWDEVVAGPRKKMHGPFFIWLHSPELLSRGEKLGLYARFHSSLPQRLSELCILIMASHWMASGEWIDHEPIARSLGVDAQALGNLRKGLPAKFKQTDEAVTYELAQELLNTHDVSDATYAKAKAVLEERGLLDVIAVLGYYSFIAMSMKAFAMKPGSGQSDPFQDRMR
jgi:4-carboxymuconolactone decarboxylase